ncbi:MAG: hypothetical protein F9K43_27475 [Bauldia sp.]|nr:MAG: hypothetical protein F9K43_27475 [Bauldia sp.]
MPQSLKIGLLWCTFFQARSLLNRPLQLRDAYRPPSLFASRMRDAAHEVEYLVCDDLLATSDLDGISRTLQDDVDLLYIMTHGVFAASGYDVYLHAANWQPAATGIGHARLTVAVFDTCKLIDTASVANWRAVWAAAGLGAHLRLLLGFDGSAVIDRASAERGKAFAENLIKGSTFADAWLTAVKATCSHSQYRKAVAIGIGDSSADALAALNTASLASMPSARGAGAPVFEERY